MRRARGEVLNHSRIAKHLAEILCELGLSEEIIGEVIAAVAPLANQIVNTPASRLEA
jgi:hypothetical protein